MTEPTEAERTTVASSLASFGVTLEPDELDRLAGGWHDQRAALDRMYALPAVRYAQPALRFHAIGHVAEWGE